MVMRRNTCRVCNGISFTKVLSLGEQPPANNLTQPGKEDEEKYPLDVYICGDCGYVCLLDIVPKDALFRNYLYVSSTTKTLPQHFKDAARRLSGLVESKPFVVEIGSNDGVLLRAFKEIGIKNTLGIEPALNVARIAREHGIETIGEFFSKGLAGKIAAEKGKADLVLANNVFAHIDDIDDAAEGVKALLKDNGFFVFEVQYLGYLIENNIYDMIYHEHLSYFSALVLEKFFHRHGMHISDVEKIATHGGSIRVYVKKGYGTRPDSLEKIISEEIELGLDKKQTYFTYAQNIEKQQQELVALLKKLKAQGKKLAGYGAPAKASTILNYCGIGTSLVDFIIDDSPHKQGLLIPGAHIPIHSRRHAGKENVDYFIMFAWNYMNEILDKENDFVKNGGKFIIPAPPFKIIP